MKRVLCGSLVLCSMLVFGPKAEAQVSVPVSHSSLINIPAAPEHYSAYGIVTPQAGTGLVINEIYIGTTSSFLTGSDQFIELYNPQSTAQYLDGKLIVRFGNGGKLSSGVLSSPAEAWKFPGRAGGKTLAVQPGKFVVIASTAKNFSNGEDLSSADFECYTGNALLDQDNSSATNLTPVGVSGFLIPDLTLSSTHDAVILADGTDTTLTNGIALTSVIDGVQYSTSAAGVLPNSIDAGITGGSGLHTGVSMERKVKGVTTLNSASDFVLVPPTPGYQHGGQTTGPIKVTDIFPLTRGRYVDYDAYATDTNGNIITSTKNRASYTVFSALQSYGGAMDAIQIRDTSNATAGIGGTASDIHYRPTAAGDIQAYADLAFMESFIPATLAALITPPNQYVDYLKSSVGQNKSYPVTTVTQDITQGSVTATIKAVVTGSYMGPESITVPKGQYDTAYKFVLKADVNVTAFGLPINSFTVAQSIWIVRDIGIVKSTMPAAKGAQLPVPGRERDMIAYGTRAVSAVEQNAQPIRTLSAYPNPAASSVTIELPSASDQITLFATDGKEILRKSLLITETAAELSTTELPNGVYVAMIHGRNGQLSMSRIVVEH